MKQNEMMPSAWLKADDVTEAGTPLHIASLEQVEFKAKDGTAEKKWVIGFSESDKKFTLNKTNQNTLFQHYADSDDWIGKAFFFCAREVQDPSGKMVMSVRVSLRKPSEPAKKAAPEDNVPF